MGGFKAEENTALWGDSIAEEERPREETEEKPLVSKEALMKALIATRAMIDDLFIMLREINKRLEEYVKIEPLREMMEEDVRYNVRYYNVILAFILEALRDRFKDYHSMMLYLIETEEIKPEEALVVLEELKKRRGLAGG